MKRKLLLCAVFFATLNVFPQSPAEKPKPNGKQDLKPLIRYQVNENAVTPSSEATTKVSPQPVENQNQGNKTNAINTWMPLSTSANIYGVLISYCNPLQLNDELNAVSFIHRKPPSYIASPAPASTAANGLMVACVSSDLGNTWDSTLIWNDDLNWGRYPGGGIYNPPLNTTLSAAYFVGMGPTTSAAGGWPGNFFASKKLDVFNNVASAAPGAQVWMDITNPDPAVKRVDFAAYGFTSTDDGKVRTLGGVTNDNLAPAQDTAVNMVTGTFVSGIFSYAGTIFSPPTTVDSQMGPNWLSRPCMAWNEAGTVGYVAVVGSRTLATGSNAGLQPIVWKTTNSGASWAMLPAIDFNNASYTKLKHNLTSVSSSTLEVPNFLWTEGIDMAVDANNKLHLFSSLVGQYSTHVDSLNFVSSFTLNTSDEYKWPHLPGLRPYLYDFMTDGTSAWSYMLVDSMSSEGASDVPTGAGFNENPWTLNGANKVRLDARLQLSRTPNGKYIFYSWTESDTNFTSSAKKYNVLPNIKARAYSVDLDTIFPQEVNVTNPLTGFNPNVASRAFYHYMANQTAAPYEVSIATSTAVIAKLPFTVSNSPGFDQLNSNTHWYNTAELTFYIGAAPPLPTAVNGNVMNNINSSVIFPNPANNKATLAIGLKQDEKIELTVINVVGEVVKTIDAKGRAGENQISIDLSGLVSGIYMVNIKLDNTTSTKKLIVE